MKQENLFECFFFVLMGRCGRVFFSNKVELTVFFPSRWLLLYACLRCDGVFRMFVLATELHRHLELAEIIHLANPALLHILAKYTLDMAFSITLFTGNLLQAIPGSQGLCLV